MQLSTRLTRFTAAAENRFPAQGETVANIHLVQAGQSGGVPVVLVHGASGNLRDWQSALLTQAATRHHVIALDRPGFGHSKVLPGWGWRLSDQVTALRQALLALGHDRYILAGHSYGGSLVMRWVLDHPAEVAGILALSAPVMDWGGSGIGLHYRLGGHPVAGPVIARLAPVLAGPAYIAQATREIFAPNPMPPAYPDQGGALLALRPRTFRANATMMLNLYPQIVEQAERYREITAPLQIVHGADDTIVPAHIHAEPLARLLPHAGLTLLPGIGHMPHHAAPEQVLDAIDRLAADAAG